jgi:hypothetical protein
MFNSIQTLGTDLFCDKVRCQHDVSMTESHRSARGWLQSGQCTVLSFDIARSGRTRWYLSALQTLCSLTRTMQPGQVVPLRVGRWNSLRLQPILASLNTPLRSLYITTLREKAEGRLTKRENKLLISIIVSFAIRLTSGTDLYRCYGQLCKHMGVPFPVHATLCSFMSLLCCFIPLTNTANREIEVC